MKIGFTGTQSGMTDAQKTAFKSLILEYKPTEFHHGCCIGADEQAHQICIDCNVPIIIIHPPINTSKQATCVLRDSDKMLEPKDYLIRNHNIVNSVDLLIATPKEAIMQQRSGTWATYRYAFKSNKTTNLIYPLGKISVK